MHWEWEKKGEIKNHHDHLFVYYTNWIFNSHCYEYCTKYKIRNIENKIRNNNNKKNYCFACTFFTQRNSKNIMNSKLNVLVSLGHILSSG